jgi:hypothetical protein
MSNLQRRAMLRAISGAVVALPLGLVAARAHGARNDVLRQSLKYQDKPNGDHSCAGCSQFVPGKSAAAMGSCKIIPNDTEISPKGWCIAWIKKT